MSGVHVPLQVGLHVFDWAVCAGFRSLDILLWLLQRIGLCFHILSLYRSMYILFLYMMYRTTDRNVFPLVCVVIGMPKPLVFDIAGVGWY